MRNLGLHIIVYTLAYSGLLGQPSWGSARAIAGMTVYQDVMDSVLYYYAPNSLELAQESNGRPKFKLVQLRYSGTFATADQGQTRNINLVQLSVLMPSVSNKYLNDVRNAFNTRVKLRPLPLKNAEGNLVTAVGGEFRRLGETSGFSSSEKNATGLWTERTFTLRLNNFDAQILWEQVQKNKLALSVNYTYYADFVEVSSQDFTIKGDSAEAAKLGKIVNSLIPRDSTLSTKIFHSDAFSIYIDCEKYPESIQQIDINESRSIAYPLLEIRCYDFTHDLRPDLGIKTIEVEAVSVSGQRILLPKINFSKSKSEQFVQQVKSKFAININRPFRYRVTNIFIDGEKQTQEWQTNHSWIGVLDISSLDENNPIQKNEIEFEVDLQQMTEKKVDAARIVLSFRKRKEQETLSLDYSKSDKSPLKSITVIHDKDTLIQYQVHWIYPNGNNRIEDLGNVGIDNYVFVNVPEN